MQQRWELPAGHPAEYHAVEARRGRRDAAASVRRSHPRRLAIAMPSSPAARAMRMALEPDPRMGGVVPSTKGTL